MKRAFIFWSCLLPVLAIIIGIGSPLVSRNLAGGQAQAKLPAASVTTPANSMNFGKIPLYFVPNQGQIDAHVSFYIQGTGETIYFAPDGVTFALSYSTEQRKEREARKLLQPPLQGDKTRMEEGMRRWAVKLDFVGARKI